MTRWIYAGFVALFWLASMTWLVTDRILPAFQPGDAPISLPARTDEPIGWRIDLNERPVGLAVMQAVSQPGRVTEVHSVVRLEEFGVPSSASSWLLPAFRTLSGLELTLSSTLTYDAFKELSSFRARLGVGKDGEPIRLNGRIADGVLKLKARYGDKVQQLNHKWPSGARLANEISPAARLLPLYEGRRWTREVLNPLAAPHAPVELIQGEVVQQVLVEHNGESINGWRIEYRSLDATGSSEENRLRAVMIADKRGNILSQQIYLLGSRLTLTRVDDETSQRLADEHLELPDRPLPQSATKPPEANAPAA